MAVQEERDDQEAFVGDGGIIGISFAIRFTYSIICMCSKIAVAKRHIRLRIISCGNHDNIQSHTNFATHFTLLALLITKRNSFP